MEARTRRRSSGVSWLISVSAPDCRSLLAFALPVDDEAVDAGLGCRDTVPDRSRKGRSRRVSRPGPFGRRPLPGTAPRPGGPGPARAVRFLRNSPGAWPRSRAEYGTAPTTTARGARRLSGGPAVPQPKSPSVTRFTLQKATWVAQYEPRRRPSGLSEILRHADHRAIVEPERRGPGQRQADPVEDRMLSDPRRAPPREASRRSRCRRRIGSGCAELLPAPSGRWPAPIRARGLSPDSPRRAYPLHQTALSSGQVAHVRSHVCSPALPNREG